MQNPTPPPHFFSESHQKKCSPLHQALQRTATANAAACNERGSAMSERQHLYIIYRSAERRTNIQDRSAKFNIYRVSLPRRKSFKQAIRQKEARLVQNDWTVTNDSSLCRSAYSISTHASTNAKKSHQYWRDSNFFLYLCKRID